MNTEVQNIINQIKSTNKTVQIKLLGDSITHGYGGTGFAQSGEPIVAGFSRNPDGHCWANSFKSFIEGRYNCKVINNACTGTDIQFVIQHIDELVSDQDDIVICAIGTNNRHKFFKDGEKPERDEFFNNFQRKVEELYEKLCERRKQIIFVANIPETYSNRIDGPDFWRILTMSDIQDAYINAQKKYCFPLIRLYDLFLQKCEEKKIDFEKLLPDELHPNDEGYDLMFEILLAEFGLENIT